MIKFIGLLWLCLGAQLLKAQSLHNLDQDPVFVTVLAKQIVYPLQAVEAKVYTRSIIYTHFRIDSVGHIRDIVTLNPSQIDYGFDKQIKQALHHLPPLKPAYQGEYVLPIRFVFAHSKGETKVDTLVSSSLTDEVLRTVYPNQTLLTERRIQAYIPMFTGNPR
jgi:hypothetical protein